MGDIPAGPHYLLIVFETYAIHHEGDERSRTAPGHGYPAYDEMIPTHRIYVTSDRNELLDFVRGQHARHAGEMVALEVNRATLPTSIVVLPGLEDH